MLDILNQIIVQINMSQRSWDIVENRITGTDAIVGQIQMRQHWRRVVKSYLKVSKVIVGQMQTMQTFKNFIFLQGTVCIITRIVIVDDQDVQLTYSRQHQQILSRNLIARQIQMVQITYAAKGEGGYIINLIIVKTQDDNTATVDEVLTDSLEANIGEFEDEIVIRTIVRDRIFDRFATWW